MSTGGHAALLEDVLHEGLRALQLRTRLVRPKRQDVRLLQLIHNAVSQRILRSNYHKVNGIARAPLHNLGHVGDFDAVDALGNISDSSVPRQAVQLAEKLRLRQLPADRVLCSTYSALSDSRCPCKTKLPRKCTQKTRSQAASLSRRLCCTECERTSSAGADHEDLQVFLLREAHSNNKVSGKGSAVALRSNSWTEGVQ